VHPAVTVTHKVHKPDFTLCAPSDANEHTALQRQLVLSENDYAGVLVCPTRAFSHQSSQSHSHPRNQRAHRHRFHPARAPPGRVPLPRAFSPPPSPRSAWPLKPIPHPTPPAPPASAPPILSLRRTRPRAFVRDIATTIFARSGRAQPRQSTQTSPGFAEYRAPCRWAWRQHPLPLPPQPR